ncbi:MAG: hypothetical protein Q7R73_00875 [bacterium]|nr:hypothetical protein [bacterium]
MKVWLDDNHTGQRPTPPGWMHAHNFSELVKLLDENPEPIEVMSFDNDLGDFDEHGRERTGYWIIQWLAENRLDRYPKKVLVHSKNCVDKPNILGFDQNVRKHLLSE